MENNIVFDYHYEEEAERYTFYRIPKALYTEPVFYKLSDGAKVLYGQLLDLMSLSRKNGWLDKEGRVYVRCSIEKINEIMNCGKDKSIDMLKELDSKEGVGLIEKVKKGQGKPTIIYVKSFVVMRNRNNDTSIKLSGGDCNITNFENQNSNNSRSDISEFVELEDENSDNQNSRIRQMRIQEIGKSEFKKSENQNSRIRLNRTQEFGNTDDNNINPDKTNASYIDSINQSYPSVLNNMMDEIRKNTEIIKTNIDYDTLMKRSSMGECERIEEMLDILVDFISIKRKNVKIKGIEYPYERVKEKLLKLNMTHIEYVLESLDHYTKKIDENEGFLITALYNASKTINHAYNAKLNHDMSKR